MWLSGPSTRRFGRRLGALALVALLLNLAAACGGGREAERAEAEAAADAPSVHYLEAFLAVETARTEVQRLAAARDALEPSAGPAVNPQLCQSFAAAGGALDSAWGALDAAYRAAGEALPPAPDRADHLRALGDRSREATIQRNLDVRHHEAWAAVCARAGQAPVVSLTAPASPPTLCGAVALKGPVVHWRGARPAEPVDPAAVVGLVEALGAEVEAPWDWLLVATEPGVDVATAEGALVVIDRGLPGRGRPPVHPEHLPSWPTLEGVVVLGQGPDALPAEAMRGLLRGHLAGLPFAAGADCGPQVTATWGASDVGGVLGGAIAGGLRMMADGRWHAVWPVLPGPRMAGNPVERVALAPIELAMLGVLPLDQVPSMTFLRRAKLVDPDHLRAAGTCRLDGAGWRALFGAPKPRTEPLRIGLVVWGGTEAQAARWGAALSSWASDASLGTLAYATFFGATRGRGRLSTPDATRRAPCVAPGPALR